MKAVLALPVLLLVLSNCAAPPPTGEVPASVAAPEFHAGEHWQYRVRDGYNGETVRSYREVLRSIDDSGTTLQVTGDKLPAPADERFTADGNPQEIRSYRTAAPVRYAPFFPAYVFPLEVGKSWKQDLTVTDAANKNIHAVLHGHVVGWEHVAVPAGEFDALKIRHDIYYDDEEFWRWGTVGSQTDWYAPAVQRFVKHEEKSEYLEKSGRWPNNVRRGDWSIVELAGHESKR